MKLRPRLRTLFIMINLIVLVLPLASILLLRLYESALVRQTEASLIAQASWLTASYAQHFRALYPDLDLQHYGKPLAETLKLDSEPLQGKWRPQLPELDLNTSTILPEAADAQASDKPVDQTALSVAKILEPILKQVQLTTLAGMRIVDIYGNVIATTGREFGYSLLNREELVTALQGRPIRVLRQRMSDNPQPLLSSISRGTNIRIFLAHPIILEQRIIGAVVLSRTPPDITQVVYAKRKLLVYFALLLLSVVIVIAIITSYSITKPVLNLVNQATKASINDHFTMPPLRHPVTYEVEQLSNALNKMVETQNKRADYIKNFASQVSHEFKTPITAIKGALELLQDHLNDMPEEKVRHFLNNMYRDTQRIQCLMTRLTQLAKADVVKITDQTSDLLEVLYNTIHRYNQLSINLEHDQDHYPLLMAPELIDSIFSNLLDNAHQHGGPLIHIKISTHQDYYQVIVSNNGAGISENNKDKIFNPFFTTARQKGGTGLGLTIISSLMRAHQGNIELQPGKNGCRFKLTFNRPERLP